MKPKICGDNDDNPKIENQKLKADDPCYVMVPLW